MSGVSKQIGAMQRASYDFEERVMGWFSEIENRVAALEKRLDKIDKAVHPVDAVAPARPLVAIPEKPQVAKAIDEQVVKPRKKKG